MFTILPSHAFVCLPACCRFAFKCVVDVLRENCQQESAIQGSGSIVADADAGRMNGEPNLAEAMAA